VPENRVVAIRLKEILNHCSLGFKNVAPTKTKLARAIVMWVIKSIS
jgi:hypothetical protein